MIRRLFAVTRTVTRVASVQSRTGLGSPVKPILGPRQIHSTAVSSTTYDDPSGSSAMANTKALEMSVATLDDFHQVANLSRNVYGGVDFLPATFPQLVNGPHTQSFLFKVGGELVAFASLLLVDGGQTVYIFAFRSKDLLKDQDILGKSLAALERYTSDRTIHPTVRKKLGVINTPLQRYGFKPIFTMLRTGRAFQASSLSRFTLKAPHGHASALRPDEVTDLFQSDHDHWAHLFPQNHFLIALRPYTVMPDNVPVILSSGCNTQFYGTKGDDGRYALLSAGSYHFCQVGLNYNMDLFGLKEATEQAVTEHLIAHVLRLQAMSSILSGTVVFQIMAEDTVKREMDSVTGELEEDFSFVWDDDLFSLWEKISESEICDIG